MFLDPDFLNDAKISAIRVHLRQIYFYLIFAWVFRTSWLKMGFWGQNRGRGGAILTPNDLVLTFRGSYVCANFSENRSRNAIVRVPADGQTDTHTDANRFYNLFHAICYSYGTDNNNHVLYSYLPERRYLIHNLRERSHNRSLIIKTTYLNEHGFLLRILHKYCH